MQRPSPAMVSTKPFRGCFTSGRVCLKVSPSTPHILCLIPDLSSSHPDPPDLGSLEQRPTIEHRTSNILRHVLVTHHRNPHPLRQFRNV